METVEKKINELKNEIVELSRRLDYCLVVARYSYSDHVTEVFYPIGKVNYMDTHRLENTLLRYNLKIPASVTTIRVSEEMHHAAKVWYQINELIKLREGMKDNEAFNHIDNNTWQNLTDISKELRDTLMHISDDETDIHPGRFVDISDNDDVYLFMKELKHRV